MIMACMTNSSVGLQTEINYLANDLVYDYHDCTSEIGGNTTSLFQHFQLTSVIL